MVCSVIHQRSLEAACMVRDHSCLTILWLACGARHMVPVEAMRIGHTSHVCATHLHSVCTLGRACHSMVHVTCPRPCMPLPHKHHGAGHWMVRAIRAPARAHALTCPTATLRVFAVFACETLIHAACLPGHGLVATAAVRVCAAGAAFVCPSSGRMR